MLSLYTIWTIARFEIKTLLRSWFFRIFTGISVLSLTVINLLLFTGWINTPWMLRGLPSGIPYINSMLLNVMQAVIALFLASDFLKRDKKLDTTEVIYMRSMTNGDYVLGKTLGILILFIGLNLLMLFIAGIINAVIPDVPIAFTAYFLYPLLVSLPTLIFIFGLSFLLMVLIRNQAVTFIVLLGTIAMTLFFLGTKIDYLFDYMAWHQPMIYSNFIGFGNLNALLIQRGMVLFIGLACIFATIKLLRRLPQSAGMQTLSKVMIIVFGAAGLGLGGLHVANYQKDQTLRKDMIALNQKHAHAARVFLTESVLDVNHAGSRIEITAVMQVTNTSDEALEALIFHLNPGLTVQAVKGLAFERDRHLLKIKTPLAPQESTQINITYSGGINEAACYLDVSDAVRRTPSLLWIMKLTQRHAVIEKDYVLLTPESNWTPMPGVSYNPDQPVAWMPQFTKYTVNVTTDAQLTIVSQGSAASHTPGRTTLTTGNPIPAPSLIIGPYEKRALDVDGVEYAIYNLPGHDYYTPWFDAIGDTLPALIRALKEEYESQLNLNYPHSKLSLIETPVQFIAWQRPWSVIFETVQPEMVLLPERAATLAIGDFRAWFGRYRRFREEEETIPAEQLQTDIFRRFVSMCFFSENMSSRFARRGNEVEGVRLPAWAKGPVFEMDYTIYPNFYTYRHYLKSDEYPIINFAFESYFNTAAQDPRMQMFRMFMDGSQDEEIRTLLNQKNISEILRDEEPGIAHEAMKSKGAQLITILKSKLDADAFETCIRRFLFNRPFKTVTLEDLLAGLKEEYAVDFTSEIADWYSADHLPGFLMSDPECYQVLDGNRTKYQVTFTISNPEPVGGVVVASIRTGGGGSGRGRGGRGGGGFFNEEPVEKTIALGPNESKEIGIVLDGEPRMMFTNTLISQNLPGSMMKFFQETNEKRNVLPFDGERPAGMITMEEPGAIIVDNEDPGFAVEDAAGVSPLRQLLKRDEEEEGGRYKSIRGNRNRPVWTPTTHPMMYGKYIRSAHFISAGSGDRKATWNAELPETGNYDVYVYLNRQRGRHSETSEKQLHQFFIHSDDGVEEVVLDAVERDTGWHLAGSYYISKGRTKVELTDKSEAGMAFADAVKWVKQ